MKQRLFILLGFIIIILLLIGLNAASYTQKQTVPDDEFNPKRSTYHTGATGTRAFYELLTATGRNVTRWQESPSALLKYDQSNNPSTFVVIGDLPRDFDEQEISDLLDWVSYGGRLVIIDRIPPRDLLKTTASWKINAVPDNAPLTVYVDPYDTNALTANTEAAKPVQPTLFTNQINAVQSSRFASSVNFERNRDNSTTVRDPQAAQTPVYDEPAYNSNSRPLPPPPPPPKSNATPEFQVTPDDNANFQVDPNSEDFVVGDAPAENAPVEREIEQPAQKNAPVVHLANNKKIILTEMPYGEGEIVYLSDPFIVANNGIRLADNAQLAINIVESGEGLIAFDEYHHGYGTNENRIFAYFSGTPVMWILLQLVAIIALVLYSQSRRFARPLPANEPNRLSKLEYVAAMAELQRRTKAFDLALENIYKDFRRRASRAVGMDAMTASHKDLAQAISERTRENAAEIREILDKAQDISFGGETNRKEVLRIVARLREIEEKLGLQRARRRGV